MKKIISFIAGLFFAPAAFCQSFNAPIFQTDVFRLDWKKDGIIVGADLAAEIYHNCYDHFVTDDEWSGKIYDKDDVNSFDRFFMHSYDEKLDTIATLMVAGTIALPFMTTAGFLYKDDSYNWEDIATCFVLLGESVVISHTVAHITKGLVLRTRPFMYYDSIADSTEPPDDDWNRSFYSGHTTMTFSAATCLSYCFCSYFPDSPWKIPVVAGSYALAATTAALRIASGNHFASDVIVGALAGSAVGFLIPWVHKVNREEMSVIVTGTGLSVAWKM